MAKFKTNIDLEALYAIFATLANVEAINETGDPNTLSLKEIQELGTSGLNEMDGMCDA